MKEFFRTRITTKLQDLATAISPNNVFFGEKFATISAADRNTLDNLQQKSQTFVSKTIYSRSLDVSFSDKL